MYETHYYEFHNRILCIKKLNKIKYREINNFVQTHDLHYTQTDNTSRHSEFVLLLITNLKNNCKYVSMYHSQKHNYSIQIRCSLSQLHKIH